MRSRIVAFAVTCGLGLSASPRLARATECVTAIAVSPCINDDTLWPHAGPARFAAVGSTETVAPGKAGFALVSSYLSRPIVLESPTPGSGGSPQYAINDQVNGSFLWSYGATDRLELDVALPITYAQGGAGLQPITGGASLKDTAIRDLRFGLAYALVPHLRAEPNLPPGSAAAHRNTWGLAARFEVSAPTGDHDQFAGERSGVFVPSLAADYRNGPWFIGIEGGARIRPITQLLNARIGTQIVGMAGIGYDILPHELLTATVEAWALPTLVGQGLGQTTPLVPAEWQVSARTAPLPGGDLSLQLGGGGGIPIEGDRQVTVPRFRFTLGVRWEPLGRDTDGDGVPDASDRCPRTSAPKTPDGCPAAGVPLPSVVALRLASSADRCTDEPDLVDGFRSDDGCPDEDQDKDGIDDRLDQCPLAAEDYAGVADGCPEKK